jgi:hypothetical protein
MPLRNIVMVRNIVAALALVVLAGCSSAPRPVFVNQAPYSVVSEQGNPPGPLVVKIKLPGLPNEEQAKSAALAVIDDRKSKFSDISVATYVARPGGPDQLYVASHFDGRETVHQFSPLVGEQKIPSH